MISTQLNVPCFWRLISMVLWLGLKLKSILWQVALQTQAVFTVMKTWILPLHQQFSKLLFHFFTLFNFFAQFWQVKKRKSGKVNLFLQGRLPKLANASGEIERKSGGLYISNWPQGQFARIFHQFLGIDNRSSQEIDGIF